MLLVPAGPRPCRREPQSRQGAATDFSTAVHRVTANASARTTRIARWPAGQVIKGSTLERVRVTGPGTRPVRVQFRVGQRWKTIRVLRTTKGRTIQISFITGRPGRWRLKVPPRPGWSGKTSKSVRVITTPPTSSPPSPSGWWAPTKGTTWQWQLSGAIDTSVNAPVFDIDGEQNTAATVAALHAKGAKVICYFDAGGWENYRADATSFPEVVKGNTVGGWPDEKWLDIRRLDILIPIMEKRVQDCVTKGFDAIEPDLMDGYTNKTGFPLTYQDQLNYNRALADLGHKYGLGVALKNDPEQVKDLVNNFDFVIVEECAQYNECSEYKPFSDAGKAVLHVEYQGTLDSFCPTTKAMGFSSMKKKLDLTSWREVCA